MSREALFIIRLFVSMVLMIPGMLLILVMGSYMLPDAAVVAAIVVSAFLLCGIIAFNE